jgi:hypothetical protein
VVELSKMFPPRCIAPGESLADAHRYAGKRELVEFLMAVAERTAATPFTRA